MKRLNASTQEHKEKSLEAQETKLSNDRNTAELEMTQEYLGEQDAFLANLNATFSDAQTTYDARHAEQLAEIQTIAETIETPRENEDQARDHFSKTNSSSLLPPTCKAFPSLGRGIALACGWRGVQNWKRQLYSWMLQELQPKHWPCR